MGGALVSLIISHGQWKANDYQVQTVQYPAVDVISKKKQNTKNPCVLSNREK